MDGDTGEVDQNID